jgi:DeoR family suf operon transcriptional repressor
MLSPQLGRNGVKSEGRHGQVRAVLDRKIAGEMINSWDFANTAAGRVLRAIQLRGEARVNDLAADLGISASAVRQHLGQLEASGAVRTSKVRDGVGRPYHVYAVTPRGHQLFHNDYGDLARFLLDEVSEVQAPDVFSRVLRRVGERLADTHRHEVEGANLAERVEALSEWLGRRGVPAHIEEAGDGYELRSFGCPYHNVAMENHAVCEIERQVMARLLWADVRRNDCVLDGGPAEEGGCKFTIHTRRSQQIDES